jgi:hypothetical protein
MDTDKIKAAAKALFFLPMGVKQHGVRVLLFPAEEWWANNQSNCRA